MPSFRKWIPKLARKIDRFSKRRPTSLPEVGFLLSRFRDTSQRARFPISRGFTAEPRSISQRPRVSRAAVQTAASARERDDGNGAPRAHDPPITLTHGTEGGCRRSLPAPSDLRRGFPSGGVVRAGCAVHGRRPLIQTKHLSSFIFPVTRPASGESSLPSANRELSHPTAPDHHLRRPPRRRCGPQPAR